MKYISWISFSIITIAFFSLSSIYEISVKDIDNHPLQLSSYSGKKIVIVVLPVSGEDSSVTASELKYIEEVYPDSLIVLGVPALDIGYSDSIKQQVKNLYQDQYSNFLLLEGMKVKKSAGADQSPLFEWLTNRDKNRRFNKDVQGTGSKYVIDQRGNLVAAFSPAIRLPSQIMQVVISGR